MFGEAKIIKNSFTVTFPRQDNIRRKANTFEDKLIGQYSVPLIIPVPDDLDPEIPRLVFGSKHGFSQILISQISVVLNVNYSQDWQVDTEKIKNYLHERVGTVFELASIMEGAKPCFCGLTTLARLPSKEITFNVVGYLSKKYFKELPDTGVTDLLQLKIASMHPNKYYSNITIKNYNLWALEEGNLEVRPLPRNQIKENGIEVIGDFNDRFSFNEYTDYTTSIESADDIIDKGLLEVVGIIADLRGD